MSEAAVALPPERAAVRGREWMVVAGHPLAALAAHRLLERGGSPVDAMIGASAVLTVVSPHAASLGGDGFMLYFDAASKRLHGLNGAGAAPASATVDRFADGIPLKGAVAAVVPALARLWEAAHARFGRLPWQTLFDAALDAAANGFALSREMVRYLHSMRELLQRDPGCAAAFYRDGVPNLGDLLVQPALARSLQGIAEQGADAFYRGASARSIAATCAERGGLIVASDLAACEVDWVEPLATSYRGLRVAAMPPNSVGPLLLMQLNALSGLAREELCSDDVDTVAWQMAATRAAFDIAHGELADPRFADVPVARWLSDDTALQMHAAMRAQLGTTPPGPGGTAGIVIADRHGNALSFLQSVFQPFGCGVLDAQSGVLLNNRLFCFSHQPGTPNVVAPRKRPMHTVNPMLVLAGERPRYVLASPGGISQTITGMQVISNLVDRGLPLHAAVDRPRWSTDRSGRRLLEDAFSEDFRQRLHARGHAAEYAAGSFYFGSMKAIEVHDSGTLAGFADHRREAAAIGV